MTFVRSSRAIVVRGMLAFCCLAVPLAAEPRAFRLPGEMPLPEWAHSAQVTRSDEPIYQAPSSAEPRRGAAARGARLPVFGSKHGPGCATRFLLVGALAWLCQDGAELSPAAPDVEGEGALAKSHDGLPYRYYFVGPDGSFGYSAVQIAEDGVPDAQLLKGFGVAVIRVEKNREGNQFGLTSEDLWVPMRDLTPVVPVAFHGRELAGTLDVAWVTSTTALASHAVDKPKDPKLKLSRFQTMDVLEQRTVGGHRWFRYAPDAWLSDRDARAPTPAELPSELRPGERWIDVDVESQVLTAYVGERPVFATLVSTGRGSNGSILATPRGTRRLWVKLRASNLDNLYY